MLYDFKINGRKTPLIQPGRIARLVVTMLELEPRFDWRALLALAGGIVAAARQIVAGALAVRTWRIDPVHSEIGFSVAGACRPRSGTRPSHEPRERHSRDVP